MCGLRTSILKWEQRVWFIKCIPSATMMTKGLSLSWGSEEQEKLVEDRRKDKEIIGVMIKEGYVPWLSLRTALYKPWNL